MTEKIEVLTGLIRPEVELIGRDGNAMSVIAACTRALRQAGNSPEVIKSFTNEAMSSDYDHVLQTAMTYCDVS